MEDNEDTNTEETPEKKIAALEAELKKMQAEAEAIKSADEKRKADADKAAAKAKADEEAAKRTESERIAALEKRAIDAERKAALSGKVSDPNLALLVADKFDTGDGVDVDALLEAYPALRVATPAAPEATPAPVGKLPGGGAPGGQIPKGQQSLEKALETKDRASINAAFDAALRERGAGA